MQGLWGDDVVTVSTTERTDLVLLIGDLLERLQELGGGEDLWAYSALPGQRIRRDNCRKVRHKLFQLLDESGVPKP